MPDPPTVVPDLTTVRLLLRRWTPAVTAAVVAGARADGWAEDFPADGDREIAGLLAADPGGPGWGRFGHRLLVERASGLLVGGAGLYPSAGGVAGDPGGAGLELGYGVVASRRGRGYATEAAKALVALARAGGVSRLVAATDPRNPASARVLERIGMRRVGTEGGLDRWAHDLGSSG